MTTAGAAPTGELSTSFATTPGPCWSRPRSSAGARSRGSLLPPNTPTHTHTLPREDRVPHQRKDHSRPRVPPQGRGQTESCLRERERARRAQEDDGDHLSSQRRGGRLPLVHFGHSRSLDPRRRERSTSRPAEAGGQPPTHRWARVTRGVSDAPAQRAGQAQTPASPTLRPLSGDPWELASGAPRSLPPATNTHHRPVPHAQVRRGKSVAGRTPPPFCTPTPATLAPSPSPRPGPARTCPTRAPRGHSPPATRPAQLGAAPSVPPGKGRAGAGRPWRGGEAVRRAT